MFLNTLPGIRAMALALLAGAALAANAAAPAKRYLITDSGAVGDGRTLNTKAIQSAIDRCAAGGGGVVVVPKGTFSTGAIFLKQGVDLSIEKDGVLKGTTNLVDYPRVPTRWEGVEREWTSALINATNMTGLQLTGEGTIDGSGDVWERLNPRSYRPPGGPSSSGSSNAPPPAAAAPGSNPRPWIGRPRQIVIQDCRNVHVAGLSLRNEASWGLVFIYCEDVLAEGLNIRVTDYVPSSDGMDVDSCRRVRISRCDIQAHDDCLAIKSGRDEDGLRVNRPCEDIVVENTRFGYGHGAVSIGSETSGSVRNVEVRDCVVEEDNWAAVRLKSARSRGGVVENITYRNVELRNVRKAFELNPAWGGAGRNSSNGPPVFRNVTLINVSGTAQSVGTVTGLSDSPILNVKFEHCQVTAQTGLVLQNVKDVDTAGLEIHVAQGEPIIRRSATAQPAAQP
jgi:exo-poly-alpha-galacturonosidase